MQTDNTIDPIPENDEIPGDEVFLDAEADDDLSGMIDSPLEVQDEAAASPPTQAKDEPEFTGDESQPPPPIEALVSESKTRRFFRAFIRWTAGTLIVFGLGFLAAIFLLYRPDLQKAKTVQQDLQAELTQAKDQITELQDQAAGLQDQVTLLKSLKETNDELLIVQQDLELHVAILDARLDVTNAMLALSDQDTARALVILDKTDETLDRIRELLPPEQQDSITALKQRLELVLSEIETDPYAAQSDLDVLATNLLQLEDSLISK